jgi:asparagine synthetase B (glutamine-hydrolysing)
MIGYVSPTDDPERISRLQRLSETTMCGPIHREEGLAILLQQPMISGDGLAYRSEIAFDPCHVLGFEGYLMDGGPGGVSQPALWLLRRLSRMGIAAFENLNGAYSFCLFNRRERHAWMGICSFGRRDLYYKCEGEGIVFASDLMGLLRLGASRPELAHDQISASFLCGATYGGETLLKGIRRALPGAVIHVTPRIIVEDPPKPFALPTDGTISSEIEALDEMDQRLRAAVTRLTRVTQKQAVLMSAGVDSPLAAAYVKCVTGKLDALTLRLPPPADEIDDAAAIVRALGGVHHVYDFSTEEVDLVKEIDALVRVMEEPTSLGLGLPMMKVARMGRILTDGFVCGVSADVFFSDLLPNDDANTNSIYHYMFRRVEPHYLQQVVRLCGSHPDEILKYLRQRFSADPLQELRLNLSIEGGLVIRYAARLANYHQAEALFPYLDRDVVDFALRLPARLRDPQKPLLRKLATRHYSADLQRPGKVPFAAHPVEWLHAAGRLGVLLDLLEERRTSERGVYREKGLKRLIGSYRTGQPERPWHLVLWQIVVFELFCRRFLDTDGTHS